MRRYLISLKRGILGATLAILAVAVGGSAVLAGPLADGIGFVQCTTTTGYMTGTSCNGGTDSGSVTYALSPG